MRLIARLLNYRIGAERNCFETLQKLNAIMLHTPGKWVDRRKQRLNSQYLILLPHCGP